MSDVATSAWSALKHAVLPQVGAAFARFPLAIIGAVVLTAFLILVTEDFRNWEHDFDFVLRIAGALACGALWSVSAVLIGEARGRPAGFGHLLGAIGAILLAAVFWFHRELDLQEYALSTALIVFVGLAPYLFRGQDNRAFWEFNHDIWIGAAFALLAAVLLAAGVSAIFSTIEYLFKVDVRNQTWPEIWIVALMCVAPLYWLNTIPKRFDLQVAEGEQQDAELTTRLITVLAKYILVPLLLVYTAILYIYAAKIGIGWELPKGKLGYMVSAFGVVGVVTALVAFPSRNHSGVVVKFFWQHWFWLTLVPLVLLFIGTWRRISDYGLTQDRYLLVLLGVWLALVVVLFGLRFISRDLRMIPRAFVALLAVTSVGPWGLEGLPLRLLVSELRDLLQADGSLDANGVIKAKVDLPKDRTREATRRMASIVRYVQRNDRLDRLRPLLGAESDQVIGEFATSRDRRRGRHKSSQRVMERLVLPTHRTTSRGQQYVHFASVLPGEISFRKGATLYGPLRLFSPKGTDIKTFRDDDKTVDAVMTSDILEIKRASIVLGRYPLRPLVEKLAKAAASTQRPFVMIDPVPGSGTSRMMVTGLSGHFDARDTLAVSSMTVWLVTPPAE